jgi:sRNA-binding regulator protein Hfq
VDELVTSGMPTPMAFAVASGRLDLNEALERLAQAAEVDRLMRDHDLTRALAKQVVLGHADLQAYLLRRRFEQHRELHAARSVLDEARASGQQLALGVFGESRINARIVANEPYQVEVELADGGGRRTLHKLDLKFAYPSETWKKARKAITRDKAAGDAPRRPAPKPQERFSVSDRRLFDWMVEAREVVVTLLDGDVITGEIQWVSRFEFAVGSRGESEIVVFRHALLRIVPGR